MACPPSVRLIRSADQSTRVELKRTEQEQFRLACDACCFRSCLPTGSVSTFMPENKDATARPKTHDSFVVDRKIVAAVKSNGVPVEYIVFPDEGHGFTKRDNRIKASDAYVAF